MDERDPIEEQGGLNLYGFVGNNPLARIDPNGQITLDEATRHWREGTGDPMDMNFNELYTNNVRISDFPQVHSLLLWCKTGEYDIDDRTSYTTNSGAFVVLEVVILRLEGSLDVCGCHYKCKGTLKSFWDTYDFDMHPWYQPIRNVETLIGRAYAGPGKKFTIRIHGFREIEESY